MQISAIVLIPRKDTIRRGSVIGIWRYVHIPVVKCYGYRLSDWHTVIVPGTTPTGIHILNSFALRVTSGEGYYI